MNPPTADGAYSRPSWRPRASESHMLFVIRHWVEQKLQLCISVNTNNL